MAVGLPLKTTYADGDVFSASDINDTNGTINITAAPFAAGKNKIINGDFAINQRQFTSVTTNNAYCFDRFKAATNGTGTFTVTPQTFTPGTAPVAGYESTNFVRQTINTVGTTTRFSIQQPIEDVRTFAGQTVTVSFWAKTDSARTLQFRFDQNFGSGGSAAVSSSVFSISSTTSWTRFSQTLTLASISGKTIGTSSNLLLLIFNANSAGSEMDLWGVQVEAGSSATDFQTASGSLGGELALCQRYYWQTGTAVFRTFAVAQYFSTTAGGAFIAMPVTMRGNPSVSASAATDFESLASSGGGETLTAISFGEHSRDGFTVNLTTAANMTAGAASILRSKSAGAASLRVSAEL
jgi:hypothetical protein